jgi:hypothetical protein
LASISGTLTQTVSKVSTTTALSSSANPSSFGAPVTFTASVSSAQGPPPDGETIKFTDGVATLGTGTLAGGVASFTTSSLTAGTHKIKASYAGDVKFGAISSTVLNQAVNGLPTTATVSADVNPSTYKQSVTFTASVIDNSSTGTPTGTVTFKVGTTALSKVVLSGGTASYSTAALAVGTKSITVSYSGDTTYAPSSSSVLTQTVNRAGSATALTSSENPSNSGDAVTFTATVGSDAGTPAGSVTFASDGKGLGTVTLVNGVAAVTTSTLKPGSHNIVATYNGNTNFVKSTTSLTQAVQ